MQNFKTPNKYNNLIGKQQIRVNQVIEKNETENKTLFKMWPIKWKEDKRIKLLAVVFKEKK